MQGRGKMRIAWSGFEDMPDFVRSCVEIEIGLLRERCQRMRAMTVECQGDMACRLSCSCADSGRRIRVTRPTVGDALVAFDAVLGTRCTAGDGSSER